MKLPLESQAEVRQDLDNAYWWNENQRSGLGEDFLEEIEKVYERIVRNPELPPLLIPGIRCVRAKRFPYGVYYRVDPDRILVFAVNHLVRDESSWKSRL